VSNETESERDRKRAENLWTPFARKFPPIARASRLEAWPRTGFASIGGLAEPKEEIQTYACAATSPEIYQRWGTVPPSGLLLIGPPESGKSLLAEALAVLTETPFLEVRVPRLVLQILHAGGQVGALLEGWEETLREMPRLTVLFRKVDFAQIQSLLQTRANVPIGPVMDFFFELLDRTVALAPMLVVGTTSHPEDLSLALLEPGRFERVVNVNPINPDDVVEALRIHAAEAERLAGRPLFDSVDWFDAVKRSPEASIGEWARLVRAILRRKARCDAADEQPGPVTTEDLIAEVERFKRTATRLPAKTGHYL
jgi:ATP-dependent 26S proteasome regulatory subunit